MCRIFQTNGLLIVNYFETKTTNVIPDFKHAQERCSIVRDHMWKTPAAALDKNRAHRIPEKTKIKRFNRKSASRVNTIMNNT